MRRLLDRASFRPWRLAVFFILPTTPLSFRTMHGSIELSFLSSVAQFRGAPFMILTAVSPRSDLATTTASMHEGETTEDHAQGQRGLLAFTQDIISKLRFRELQRELENRSLPTLGTTSQLRTRLREAVLPDEEEVCIVNEDGIEDDCEPSPSRPLEQFVTFVDATDPNAEAKELLSEIAGKADKGHWKAATRKLKRLTRRHAGYSIPEGVYLKILEACMANRLQGARASEPTRKILEQMAEQGYIIPEQAGNYCVKNCLGDDGIDSTHQGFGGIDTALAMLAALEMSGTPIQLDTYDKVCIALAREGSIDDAVKMLRKVVVDRSETPPLLTFAEVASASVKKPDLQSAEKALNVLAISKAAGYDLDNIASIHDGRTLLACGVIAAERLDNVGLGLRLLTSASNAKGVDPDRGDNLVASSSSAAQRASTLLHKKAINRAVEDGQWKLAVKALELMLERSLKPSPWVWRNVVTCCAKNQKSKKATSLLMDWVKLAENGLIEKPPVSVFNTCINVCEICDEQKLTVAVLDAMKKTHDTEGNIITFNIALKRLAKLGNYQACEGIIVDMLTEGVAPSVVSYTTAIAACAASEVKQPAKAYEWMKRMRSLNVMPNILTYNTALAACLDGKLESTLLASTIATEIITDVQQKLLEEEPSTDEFSTVIPDASTKVLARRLTEQMEQNVKDGLVDRRVASETMGLTFSRLVDFDQSEVAEAARQKASKRTRVDEDQALATYRDEVELEYSAAATTHRSAEV